jgi:hypothetical protein
MDKAIEEIKNSNFEFPSFLQENEERRKKWAHLTEDLDDYKRLCLETVLENTQQWIINETTTTGNVGTFTTYAFPIIRRIMPDLFANELVSVQPIPMPTAMIFYIDFEYGSALNLAESPVLSGGERVDLKDNFHPLYSAGSVRGDLVGLGDGSNVTFTTTYRPFVQNSELVYVDGALQSPSGVDYTANQTTGVITFEVGSTPADGAAVTVDYTIAPTEGGNPREIDLRISSDSVYSETKRLKAMWTIEAQQDLKAYHGINIEPELMGVVGSTVKREIDQSILGDLRTAASLPTGAGNVNWSSTIGPAFNGSQREWDLTLYNAIVDANALIYNRRMVNATWIVAGSNACTRLEKLEGFTEQHRDWAVTGMGMERFGVLKNRFNVYKDPWAPADSMLIGYKGSSMLETGYIYAPYVPLYTSPLIIDPNDFTPRRGIMSRYARKLVDPSFYATVTIT